MLIEMNTDLCMHRDTTPYPCTGGHADWTEDWIVQHRNNHNNICVLGHNHVYAKHGLQSFSSYNRGQDRLDIITALWKMKTMHEYEMWLHRSWSYINPKTIIQVPCHCKCEGVPVKTCQNRSSTETGVSKALNNIISNSSPQMHYILVKVSPSYHDMAIFVWCEQ